MASLPSMGRSSCLSAESWETSREEAAPISAGLRVAPVATQDLKGAAGFESWETQQRSLVETPASLRYGVGKKQSGEEISCFFVASL